MAQVMFDNFISVSTFEMGSKIWSCYAITTWYEGQGPEHSSSRMERYLTIIS